MLYLRGCSAAPLIICACVLCLFSITVKAIDESRLWLPKRYQIYYLPLVEAAQAAESVDRCVQVLEGTIDLDQSKSKHPIFRFLCRQANNKTYNEMVDGLTFETLTTRKVLEPVLTEEELEALRQAEEARLAAALERKKAEFWQMCFDALQQETQLMLERVWLTSMPPEPEELSEQQAQFSVDFNAKNMWGKDLHYRALCNVNDQEKKPLITVTSRP